MSYALDLHTHSTASPDGGLHMNDYAHMLQKGPLDYIAITDHGRIDFALQAQAELGPQIIVGEEIKTTDGELIGLFLHAAVPEGLTAAETAKRIHAQQGLVYVPHAFETMRSGLSGSCLDALAPYIDIVETYNSRALARSSRKRAQAWQRTHHKAGVASSDAHGPAGWGRTYTNIEIKPTPETLVHALQTARYHTRFIGLQGITYPTRNRLAHRRQDHAR